MYDWNEVSRKIAEDDAGKWDRIVAADRLRIAASDGAMELNGGDNAAERFSLSELAQAQMCGRLGIPVAYYRRLPADLKAPLVAHDLNRLPDHRFTLRGKNGVVRAFLSSEYVPYDNAELAGTVGALLRNGPVTVKSFVLEETHLYLKLISEEIVDQSAGLKAGVMFGNSEVGLGSISVEPFVFRLPCTNDLVVARQKSFRHPHIHLTAKEFGRRIAAALADAFRLASALIDEFLKAHEDPLPDPVKAIRELALARRFSQKFSDQVIASYAAEPEPTRFGLINAFSRAAQTLAPLGRIEIERFAGSLLTAPL